MDYRYEEIEGFFSEDNGIICDSYDEFTQVLDQLMEIGFRIGFDDREYYIDRNVFRIRFGKNKPRNKEIHAAFDGSARYEMRESDITAQDFFSLIRVKFDLEAEDVMMLYEGIVVR